MSKSPLERALPDRVDPEWYRKAAKKQLKRLRASQPAAQLADAQRAVAREHGFASWRKLKDRIEAMALQRAFDQDDGPALAKLLAANPALSKTINFTWTHPSGDRRALPPMVIAACMRKNADMVRALIAAGVNVNAPAVYAANRPDLMRLLLDVGMNPNAITFPEHCTGLMYAAFIDDLENARLLLDRKADPRIALPNCGSTALHWLNWRPEKKRVADTIELAKLLAAAGADVNARTFSGLNDQPITDDGNLYLVEHGGATALHWAAANGTEPLVRALLALGADRTLRTVSHFKAKKHPADEKRWAFEPIDGLTPAALAKHNGHDAVALLLGNSSVAIAVATVVDPTPLIEAIRVGDTALAARLIKVTPALAQAQNSDGASMLHVAVEFDRAAIVKTLIDAGADLHAVYGRSVHTPLSWSIVVGAFDSAAVLVKAGVKPDLYCAAGLNEVEALANWFGADGFALPGASTTGSTRFLADDTKLPSPPTDPVELASDALVLACRNGRVSAVKFLLTKNIGLNFRAYMGGTALHWANCNGDRKVIAMLTAAGADQAARDDVMRATPRAFGICVPASWGHITWLKRAIARDKSLANCFDARGTPLHEAARNGQAGSVRLLLKAGADPATRDADGKTPHDLAREKNHEAVAKLLNVSTLATTSPANTWSADTLPLRRKSHKIAQWKPLMDAAYAGDLVNATKLLDGGADPDVLSSTPHKHRPLHRAIERKKSAPRGTGHLAVVQLLLERGADPMLRGTHGGHTALQLAAIDSPMFVPLLRDRFEPFDFFHAVVMLDAKRVTALLKRDPALASKRDENEWLPLHYACASALFKSGLREADAQARIMAALIDAGADVNATFAFDGGWPIPPLFYACGYHDNPRATEQMIRAGANPCDQESVYHASDEGHAACLAVIEKLTDRQKLAAECTRCLATQLNFGHSSAATWLLAHGANPNTLHPRFGRSALHGAALQGASDAVLRLLLRHGGDPTVKTKDGKTAIELAKSKGKARVVKTLSA